MSTLKALQDELKILRDRRNKCFLDAMVAASCEERIAYMTLYGQVQADIMELKQKISRLV